MDPCVAGDQAISSSWSMLLASGCEGPFTTAEFDNFISSFQCWNHLGKPLTKLGDWEKGKLDYKTSSGKCLGFPFDLKA